MACSDSLARFDALGGTAVVAVCDPARLGAARAAVQRTVEAFDRACSSFVQDSELSKLNRAAGAPVRVTPLLLDAVQAALHAARVTDGDVDPTIGASLVALGAYPGAGAVSGGHHPDPRMRFVAIPGWRSVHVDRGAGTIRLARGVRLDLGATAKALAADRAAAAAHEVAGCGVLVSLSGDIAIAGPSPTLGWRVRVTDDHRSDVDVPGQWITLRSGGLATSSTTVRSWPAAGRKIHHVIDPSTGQPAAVIWRTASVAAASCLDANTASTAAIVRGERAADWLTFLGLPSRLVAARGAARHVAGWPAEGEDLTDDRAAFP